MMVEDGDSVMMIGVSSATFKDDVQWAGDGVMKEEIGVAMVRQMVRKRKQGFIVVCEVYEGLW